MFTGIVEELGTVAAVEDQGDAIRLTVRADHRARRRPPRRLDLRQRLLPDRGRAPTATPGPPTSCRRRSTRPRCAASAPGDRVNLERAVTADKRLGGHIVQGHVDAVGTILSRDAQRALGGRRGLAARRPRAATSSTRARSPSTGSASPSSRRGDDRSRVSLIPETLARTTLGTQQPGDRVNLEVDVIAKHVEKLVRAYLPRSTPMTDTHDETVRLDTVERAIADIAAGKPVVVVDDEDPRERGRPHLRRSQGDARS